MTGWLPTGSVAILSGRGGFGKSRLALQLAAGVASGGDATRTASPTVWIRGAGRQRPTPCRLGTDAAPALYVSWEDDSRRVHPTGCLRSPAPRRPHG